jgi:16S rRNA (cytosine1402-N4)-methyltransferase
MRMDTRTGPTAGQVVNEMGERELANLIYEYGEERRSRTVARAIVRGRPVTSTAQLARIVASAAPPMKFGQIHPATRTFQALRIYVNHELDEIHKLLEAVPELLKPSARRRTAGSLEHSYEEAGDGRRRRDRSESALAERKVKGSRTNPGKTPKFR